MVAQPGPSSVVVAVLCTLGFFGVGPLLSERQTETEELGVFGRVWNRLWVGLASIGLCTLCALWAWASGRIHLGGGGSTEVRVATAVTVNLPDTLDSIDGNGSPRSKTFIRRRGGGRLE